MTSRSIPAAAALVIVAAMTSGCSSPPDPEPAPVFASEAEAFAAAEATYRAYVDAVNDHRNDPSSDVNPDSFLIGQALEERISTQQQLDEAGLGVAGPTLIVSIVGQNADLGTSEVSIDTCLDSTQTRVVDLSGDDVTPSDRNVLTALRVGLQIVGEEFLIETSESIESAGC